LKLEYFIAKRITGGNKEHRGLSKPIVQIATGGIILGMAVMILTIFIVKGFQKEVRERTIAFGAHIQILNAANNSLEPKPVSEKQDFLEELKKDPRIAHIQKFATKNGIIKTKKENEGVIVKGVGQDYNWGFIGGHIVSGQAFDPAAKTEKRQAIISKFLSDRLGLVAGDKMIIHFWSEVEASDTSAIEPDSTLTEPAGTFTKLEHNTRDFIISGVYETGMEEFDRKMVFAQLNVIKDVNRWKKDETGGFEITLNNFSELDESEENPLILYWRLIAERLGIELEEKEYVAEKVYDMTGSELTSQTIKQLNPSIFEWLAMHDTTAWIVLILMVIVSVINMISALIILILEKTNMIGILKAIGLDNSRVKRIFLAQAARLIGKGMFWGNILGIGIALLQYNFHLATLDQATYYISFVPIKFEWWYLLWLNLGTFTICILFMLLPAIIISRTTPIRAIRFN
jgi:lipoprotein-releasing system permease protein